MKKIFLVGDNASKKFGGEAFLPLQLFCHLFAKKTPVTLLVHERVRNELEKELSKEEFQNVTFVQDNWLQKLLHRISCFLPLPARAYSTGPFISLITQYNQRKILRKKIQEDQVSLIHQITPVSPRMPSLFFGLNVPVIIGPMNGNIDYPKPLKKHFSSSEQILRALSQPLTNLSNRVFSGKLHAKMLLVANKRTLAALPKGYSGKTFFLPENGVEWDLWNHQKSERQSNKTMHFVFAGRLVPVKGLDLLLEAFKKVAQETNSHLEIIGEGPMQPQLESLVASLDLQNYVHFSGMVSQQQIAKKFAAANIFVFPSVRECGGAAVLEAMASGLPVIAINWGGPSDYLTPECGVLIEPDTRKKLIKKLTFSMIALAKDAQKRQQMGETAKKIAREKYSWESKTEIFQEIYKEIVKD